MHNGGIVENGYHDDDLVAENGVDHKALENGEDKKRWSFPPVLDDFNLMESDIDPSELEAIFADERCAYIFSLSFFLWLFDLLSSYMYISLFLLPFVLSLSLSLSLYIYLPLSL